MAEIFTIAERRISGTGLILPTPSQLNYRRYTLFADIIRKPRSPYFSAETSPPKTFYGYISLMKGDYVLQTYSIQFDAEIWYFDADITGQVVNNLKCVYSGVLQSFANLGTALGLTVTSVENAIADFKNLPLQWDSIRVKCYADTAIQFVLKGQEYDACSEADKVPREPAAAPTKPVAVAPGVATNISPAYSGDTITDPATIDDSFVPPPVGIDCQPYTLSFDYTFSLSGGPPQSGSQSLPVYGPVSTNLRIKTGINGVIETEHRGFPVFQGCQAYGYKDVLSIGSTREILTISNVLVT